MVLYNTDLFGTELEKNKGKIFLSKAWCILAYCANYTLKNIKILPDFIPKDQEGIRKERLICFIANEKRISKQKN